MADGMKVSKDLLYGIVIVALVGLLAISVATDAFDLGGSDSGTTAQTTTQPTGDTAQPSGSTGNGGSTSDKVDDLMDDDMSLGNTSAGIVIVEFSDSQCPYCRKFWNDSFGKLKSEYIDTGKVEYVYRDFPLSFHPAAQKAAEAMECADDQGKGWELHDKMYLEQNKQGTGTVQFSVSDMKRWAKEIGVDSTSFDGCLDSGKYASEVADDMRDGAAAGVSGTPAFFIMKRDGSQVVPITGAQPYNTFKSTIDQLLD